MAKTILIPIDFKIESLNTLKLALNSLKSEHTNVVLMYTEYLTDSITELLFYSPKKIIKSLKSPEFEEAISIIKNRYETMIDSIDIKLFHGYNVNAFKIFVEAKKIDTIYIPKNYSLRTSQNGFNPIPLIKKSKLPYQEIEWETSTYTSEQVQLNALFSN
jgi:hypothetical protein